MSIMGNGQPSPEQIEEMREQQRREEQEREARQTAQQMASQAAMEQGRADQGYWERITNPDIGREQDNENLEEYAKTEFGSHFALGNISKADWQSLSWQIETEFWTMLNELKDADTKMGDDDLRIMYGEDRPELTDEMARRHRSAMQNKKLFASLSINARGLRSGTEIHAVAKTEKDEENEEDQGAISRAKNWLSG